MGHFLSELQTLSPDHVPTSLPTPRLGEKRPKVKKPKVEFPVYEPTQESVSHPSYDQTTSIEEIEDEMDDWLRERKATKKKV